jgi:uncharacterized protein DUF4416
VAEPRPPVPCLLVVAAFSRYSEALDWGRDRLETLYGPLGVAGLPYAFHHTSYYQATMGTELRKQLLGFQRLVSPDVLSAIKLQTNALEDEVSRQGRFPEVRPLNLDPGLLHLGKFMLASMKDQAQRIYLRDGVYAEITLRFEAGEFEPWSWTYADYREPIVRAILKDFRDYYRRQLSERKN